MNCCDDNVTETAEVTVVCCDEEMYFINNFLGPNGKPSSRRSCIDHSTMIKRLQHTFGITGLALDWMTSYLLSRKSFVRFSDVSSATSTVVYGVPQGSSLGPLLFSLYIAPLSTIVRSFGLMHHQYADDSQIYVSAMKNELSVKAEILERCTADVHAWLLHNGLQLNPQKSDVIYSSLSVGAENELMISTPS